MTARRYDVASLTLSKAKRLDNGWLRAPAFLTRTGIFEYRRDGKVRRELRLPEDVFKAESLESFALVPLTNDHPDEPEGLTAQNAAKYQVGTVGENIVRDGDKVAATLLLTEAKAIEQLLAGKSQISCGYFCDTEETPGIWEGQPYDAIQRNIRGNHVAMLYRGRAGPEIRVRLDSADAIMIGVDPSLGLPQDAETVKPNPPEPKMLKYVIDGLEFEVSSQAAQAFAKAEKIAAEKIAAEKAEVVKVTARADAAEKALDTTKATLATTEKARTDAADPKLFEAKVSERVALLAQAREVLGSEFKADGLDSDGIRKAVIAKLDPEFKADGKSSDALTATFEASIKFRKPALPVVRVDATDPEVAASPRVAHFAAIDAQFNGGKSK